MRVSESECVCQREREIERNEEWVKAKMGRIREKEWLKEERAGEKE